MSALVHCDGPDCTETRYTETAIFRRISDGHWLHLTEGPDAEPRDFHSRDCIIKWVASGTDLARFSAEVKERLHRHEWADWIEQHDGNVGATPLTIEAIIQALRMPHPPFGASANTEVTT